MIKFENRNRYRIAPKCPCGKSNRDGKFAPLKDNPKCGKCHSCGKFFGEGNEGIGFNFPNNAIGAEEPLRLFLRANGLEHAADAYKLGCYMGKTLFPYIDIYNNYVTGKVILYGDNLKRNRNIPPSYIHPQGYKPPKVYFGEHLIKRDTNIYVVESEKSAVLYYAYTGNITIATGGKNNISHLLYKLEGYKLILLPDKDAIDEWSRLGNVYYLWYLIASKSNDKNYDVGDYVYQNICKR